MYACHNSFLLSNKEFPSLFVTSNLPHFYGIEKRVKKKRLVSLPLRNVLLWYAVNDVNSYRLVQRQYRGQCNLVARSGCYVS